MYVTIKILDENDNPPKFSLPSYSGNIEENAPVGTRIAMVFLRELLFFRNKSEVILSSEIRSLRRTVLNSTEPDIFFVC